MTSNPLALAIEKAGGKAALASALGIKPPSIYSWRRTPAGRVIDVERITGVPREELRPDLYPSLKKTGHRVGNRSRSAGAGSQS